MKVFTKRLALALVRRGLAQMGADGNARLARHLRARRRVLLDGSIARQGAG